MNDITAIILTKNEELNIARCITSIKGLADRIVVVDSGSTDKTMDIAKGLEQRFISMSPLSIMQNSLTGH